MPRPELKFTNRYSVQASGATAVAAGATATGTNFNAKLITKIDPFSAFRIISGLATLADAANTGSLSIRSFQVRLLLANSAGAGIRPVRSWQAQVGSLLVGSSGLSVDFGTEEPIFGTDYADMASAFTSVAGSYVLVGTADCANSSAGALNLTYIMSALIEVYAIQVPRV